MRSGSDLQSHQFVRRRAVGALAMRDPNPATSVLRRVAGSLFASLMLAVLAVAAVAVYGMLRPGAGTAWRDARAMIIEQETGARYVFVDGTLHPVLNHTSAVLILGTTATVRVPRASLLDVPRGPAIGIAGAPDPLPASDHLVTGPWTLCRVPTADATTGQPGAESVLSVGWAPPVAALGDEGVLAEDPTGGLHLLWRGHRYALPEPAVVLAAFTWAEASATPVPAAVLNAIPAGPDLRPVRTPRTGGASAVPGMRVGEVFVVTNPDGNRLYGVALADGVSTITAVQAALLVADRANGGGPARSLSPATYAEARQLASLIPTGDDAPPETTPTQVRPGEDALVCATFRDRSRTPVLTVTDDPPALAAPPVVETAGDVPALRVDRVTVPPGRGVLVEALAGPDSATGALSLVTDLGRRFAVPSPQVAATLGYPEVVPVRLPAALVSLIPPGSALDPAAAGLPVP